MTTTRRSMVAALTGAAMIGPASASILDDSPDAALLALGAALDAAWLAEKAEDLRYRQTREWGDDTAFLRCKSIAERIACTPAYTLDGLRVKAKAISWCHCAESVDLAPTLAHTTDLQIAHSILRDLGLAIVDPEEREP